MFLFPQNPSKVDFKAVESFRFSESMSTQENLLHKTEIKDILCEM